MKTQCLDIRGEICPFTLINTKKRMAELARGERLEILIDNHEATLTIPQWAKHAGHKLLELQEQADGWRLILEKG
jgi:tRNA 2-thiouridine synthesizing protein A